jgi:hypothetical protein
MKRFYKFGRKTASQGKIRTKNNTNSIALTKGRVPLKIDSRGTLICIRGKNKHVILGVAPARTTSA